MENCEHSFCDEMFSVAWPFFAQLFSIYGICYSNLVSSVYVLLPDKIEDTYCRKFDTLKQGWAS